MTIYNNVPTFSYIHATGISVTWNNELYMVQDFSTNKKYVYWNADIPYQLNASNIMPNRSNKQHLVLINDNGIATEVPPTTEDFSISYDGNSVQAIKDRVYGLYAKNEEFGEKFVAIETDIDGLKSIVGESGSLDENFNEVWEKISEIEQKSDEIDLTVKETSKNYNDDKQTNKLREDLNGSIITINSSLGTFKSEINDYFKNQKISDEEKVKVETQIEILETQKAVVDECVDKVILIAEEGNLGQNVVALDSAKKALQNAHNNLKNNITNAVLDKIITPTENTIIIDAFAKYNLRLNELKSTCDDVILLGLGGVLIEELGKINVKSDEIKLSISKVESSFKSEMSVQKIELESQIQDVLSALDTFEDTVNTVFKDGVIDEAEKQILTEKLANLEKEKTDVDTKFSTISSDANLSSNIKSDLVNRYNDYNTKYNNLKTKIQQVISDNIVNDAEKLQVDTLFKQYSNAISSFLTSINKAIEDISFNLAKVELEQAKNDLKNEINEVKDSIVGIEDVIDGTFENNILDEVERKNITQNLEELARERLDIDSAYTELYNNTYLKGEAKTLLKTRYDNYVLKYNDIVRVSNGILNKEELISDTDRVNLNSAIAKYKEALSLFHTQANKAIDVIATNKVDSAKAEVNGDIDDLRNEVGGLNTYIDETFKNNVIDDAERKAIKQNIETLNREKADVDKTYKSLYANTYLDGQLKIDLKSSYDNFISKHSNILNIIQGILDKKTLINDTDRNNMGSAFTQLNSSLSTFIENANKSSLYITTKSIEVAKNELKEDIEDANERIDSVLKDINGVITDGIVDQAESIIIADNINKLNQEKLELNLKFETIYNNPDLVNGSEKTNLANAKSGFDTKVANLINIINTIVQDEKVTEEEKLRLKTATNEYNTSFATLSNCFDICIDSIAKKKADDVSSELSKELSELQGALTGLEDTMNSTFKDGILSDAEKKAIMQNLKALETSKLNIDKQYKVVYNNASLSGNAKSNLKTAYDTYISKYNNLITVINSVLNKTGLLVESDNTRINSAFAEHNTAMSNYNEKINIAIDYIAKKDVEVAKNELASDINDLSNALGNLENTMNGAFLDGVLSESEKLSINQHLLTLSSEKSDIDKQYTAINSNELLDGTNKTNLVNSYNNYISSYNTLVSTINTILNKTTVVDSTDRTKLSNAFKTHDQKLGIYTENAIKALDYISQKKAEVESEKVDEKYAEIIIDLENGITSKVESINSQIDGTGGIKDRLNKAEQKITDSSIVQTVTNSQTIKDMQNGIATNKTNIATISQRADSITLEVSKKVGTNNIISSINQTAEAIRINASKINLSGYVTFSQLGDYVTEDDLSQYGTTTIHGNRIATGSIKVNTLSSNNDNPIIRLFPTVDKDGYGGYCSIDATKQYEQGIGDSIRLKVDNYNYMKVSPTGTNSKGEKVEAHMALFSDLYPEHEVMIFRGSNTCGKIHTTQGILSMYGGNMYYGNNGTTSDKKIAFSDDVNNAVQNTVQWSYIKNKPTTFTPAFHTHSEYASSSHTHSNYASSSYFIGGSSTSKMTNSYSTSNYVQIYGGNEVELRSGSARLFLTNYSAYVFYPSSTNTTDLGSSSNRWRTLYSVNSVNISDKKFKKNIKYVDDNKICSRSLDDKTAFLDFVKNDLKVATYTYTVKDEDGYSPLANDQIGFIANDIADTKVGQTFIYDYGKNDGYMFSPTGYTTVVAKALQEEIKKREELEDRVAKLEDLVKELLTKIEG